MGVFKRCPAITFAGWEDRQGQEALPRQGEVSRGHSTGGIVGRWEGPNAKPSVKTFVLVIVALTAANPFGGLTGEVRR